MRKVYYALVLFVVSVPLLFIYARWIEPNWLSVSSIEIKIPGLDPRLEGFTILHLSDLHQKRFGQEQSRLLRAIGEHEYHIVAITGDVLDYPTPHDFEPTRELLAGLGAPVFFVFGNHDYPTYQRLSEALMEAGVDVLENTWSQVDHAGAIIQVAGVHDPHWTKNNYSTWLRTDLNQALKGIDSSQFTLLLSHSPGILDAAAEAKIPLVLTGHTHGGQIKIPLLGAPTTASGKWFDKYVQGLYRQGNTQLYIHRGLGTTAMPLRFLSRPEIVFLRLVPAN